MTEIEIRKSMQDKLSEIIKQELNNIAPEVDLANIDPAADLREAADIDSMDFLNLVTALHHRTGIDVPETDYPKLVTLSGIVAYLEAKLGSAKA